MTDFTSWTAATGSMPWGVQSAFKTALEAVADGQIKMVWGADSYNGSPCLVNAINQMIHKDAAHSPSNFAGEVVSAFDSVNCSLYKAIGEPNADSNYVTPFVAEILLQKFGVMALQPQDVEIKKEPSVMDDPYVEKSDEALMTEWLTAQTKPEVVECLPDVPDVTPEAMAEVEAFLKFKA
jgi:hypothetical protein